MSADARVPRTAGFSLARAWAIALKEFVQMRRDRLTFAMIIGVPILQVVLFGYAINTDPKSLPTAVVDYDHSEFTRSIVQGLRNTGYFAIDRTPASESGADELLDRGDVQFAIVIPAGFSRALLRGEQPSLLLAADATDPSAASNAIAAVSQAGASALAHDLTGLLGVILQLTMVLMAAYAVARERERGTFESL